MIQKLSKAKISFIKALSVKKYRQQHQLFTVEGSKIVNELMKSELIIKYIIVTEEQSYNFQITGTEIIIADKEGIKKISNQKTPPSVIAVVEIPDYKIDILSLKDKLTIAIDDIQDPGNMGTIMRICDWFGIENIICSKNSVDIYNPKVIQATMGAFLRVKVFYRDLQNFIPEYKKITGNICHGTFLDGENIYGITEKNNGLIIFGNEGQGISAEIENHIDKKIFIPPFFKDKEHAESLNISIATAIVCSEFRRDRNISSIIK
jgi:TrmH family RNA methyltransferase